MDSHNLSAASRSVTQGNKQRNIQQQQFDTAAALQDSTTPPNSPAAAKFVACNTNAPAATGDWMEADERSAVGKEKEQQQQQAEQDEDNELINRPNNLYADPLNLFSGPQQHHQIDDAASTTRTKLYSRKTIDHAVVQETQHKIQNYQRKCRENRKSILEIRRLVDKIDQTANKPVWAMCAEHNKDDEIITCFIKQCDANEDSQQFASLAPHIAAQNGNLTALLLMRECSADFDIKDVDDRTPLFYAIVHGHYNAVLFLLNSGASVNVQDNNGDTPLHVAILIPPHTLRSHPTSSSHPSSNNDIRALIIKDLLEAGANPNIRNHEEMTPLMLVMMLPDVEKECVRAFFDNQLHDLPVDPSVQGPQGMTALHIAARYARPTDPKHVRSAVNYQQSPAVAARGEEKSSSQFFAFPSSSSSASGSNVALTDTYQHLMPPNDLLAEQNESSEGRADRLKMLEWILYSNCDVNARDRMGRTALHVAVSDKPPALLNFRVLLDLAQHGCIVTSVSEEGYAVLDMLSHMGDERANILRAAVLSSYTEHMQLISRGVKPSCYDFSRGFSKFPIPVYNSLHFNPNWLTAKASSSKSSTQANENNNNESENEKETEPSFVFIPHEQLELVEFLSCNCGRDSNCDFISCDNCLASALHPQISAYARGQRLVARDPQRKLTAAVQRQVSGYAGSRALDKQRTDEWQKFEDDQQSNQQQQQQSGGNNDSNESSNASQKYRLSEQRWLAQLTPHQQHAFNCEVEARTNSRQFHYTCNGLLRAFAESNPLPGHMQPLSQFNFDELIRYEWEKYVDDLQQQSQFSESHATDDETAVVIVRGTERLTTSATTDDDDAENLHSGQTISKHLNGPSASSSSLGAASSSSSRKVAAAAANSTKDYYVKILSKDDPQAANVYDDWMLKTNKIIIDVPKEPFFIRECNSLCLCSGRCANRLTQRRDAEARVRIERARRTVALDTAATHFGALTLDFDALSEKMQALVDAEGASGNDDNDEAIIAALGLQDLVAFAAGGSADMTTITAGSNNRSSKRSKATTASETSNNIVNNKLAASVSSLDVDGGGKKIGGSQAASRKTRLENRAGSTLTDKSHQSHLSTTSSSKRSRQSGGSGAATVADKSQQGKRKLSNSTTAMSEFSDSTPNADKTTADKSDVDDSMVNAGDADDADDAGTPDDDDYIAGAGAAAAVADSIMDTIATIDRGGKKNGSASSTATTTTTKQQQCKPPTDGWVVKPLVPLKPGQFICFYAGIVRHRDSVFNNKSASKSAAGRTMTTSDKKRYIPLNAQKDLLIDCSFYGNVSRLFLMSAEHANVEAVPVFHDVAPFPKVAFFARRWIFPHEPLVFDPDTTHRRFAQDWPRVLMDEALRIRRLFPFYLRDKDVRILKDQARWNRLVPGNLAHLAVSTPDPEEDSDDNIATAAAAAVKSSAITTTASSFDSKISTSSKTSAGAIQLPPAKPAAAAVAVHPPKPALVNGVVAKARPRISFVANLTTSASTTTTTGSDDDIQIIEDEGVDLTSSRATNK